LRLSADICYYIDMRPILTKKMLNKQGIGAFFRPKDITPLGISFQNLQQLVDEGEVEKVGRGLYRLSEFEPTEKESIAMVSRAVPGAVICLLSALGIHEIGTQLPPDVWIGIDRKNRKPAGLPVGVRVVRFSGIMLRYGVITQSMLGVPVRVTSPARTVVDCFRYRNKVGLDVAMEALRDVVRQRKASIDDIWRAAEVCRIRTVIKPYLEALSA
jgi:predicted transcriptional regulator of viral defense system